MKEAPLKELVDEVDEPSTDPCTKRWFGPLTSGGFRGSLLTLCSSTIGVGFLTLPEIGKKSGGYMMVVLIVSSALISMFANWQISRGFRATGGKTYSKIVARVDGRLSSLINMIFLFLYVYVSAGAYYLFGAKFAWAAIDSLEINKNWQLSEDDFTNYFIMGSFLVCFAGSLPSKITALRYFTFITAVINLFLGGLLIYQISPIKDRYINDAKDLGPAGKAPEFFDFKIDRNIFGSYCLSLFSAVNQFSVVNVLTEYKNPTQRRVNKLVFRSPIIILAVYISVALGGYYTCGTQCPEIIILRLSAAGDKTDLLMNICRFGLLICLVVGIIIRNQSNKAAIFGIIDQFKKINEETDAAPEANKQNTSDYKSVGTGDTSQMSGLGDRISEEMRKASSAVLAEQVDNTPFIVIFLIQLVNCSVPAAVAILSKKYLIEYVEAGSGFLAPVFIIIYPCLITIRLHQRGVAPVSPQMYIGIWVYLVVAAVLSYTALVFNFYDSFFGEKTH